MPDLVYGNRVFETTTSQGTSTINLIGAQTGFQSFVAGIGDGNECYYLIDDGVNWEVGKGTVTAGSPDTLSRDVVLESTNNDAAVNWGGGTRNVRCVAPASTFINVLTANTFEGNQTFQADIIAQAKARLPFKSELTISAGGVTPTGVTHTIDTEADTASDDLLNINGGVDGQILIVRPAHTDRSVVLKHDTDDSGNIRTHNAEDIILDNTEKAALLQYDNALSKWLVIASQVNEFTIDDNSIGNQKLAGTALSDKTANGGTHDVDIRNADWVKITATANSSITFTTTSGKVEAMILECVNFGNYTISWPAAVKWAYGAAPDFATSSTDHVLIYKNADDVVHGVVINREVS